MLGMNDRPVDGHISETQSHPISIFAVRTSVVHIIVQSVLFRIWVLERLLVGSLIFGNILHCMHYISTYSVFLEVGVRDTPDKGMFSHLEVVYEITN